MICNTKVGGEETISRLLMDATSILSKSQKSTERNRSAAKSFKRIIFRGELECCKWLLTDVPCCLFADGKWRARPFDVSAPRWPPRPQGTNSERDSRRKHQHNNKISGYSPHEAE
ncbi:hypothetical protein OUZ56_001527 [Daphnia magna]|uniref:Uncharacterized protein n=1 Tax=Daphnia magna TaxID=35525 RepID=A0ABR0A2Z5_9CRUS|nr:hypothetical protein OUZ56_001527 [Daphnia magna]